MRIVSEGCELELIAIPPGQFLMGSGNVLFGEAPAHSVAIGHSFWLGKYQVTQGQWQAVMGVGTPMPMSQHPADGISWNQANDFCHRLSERTGLGVRLPSEAEWEYACRAGTTSEFFFTSQGPFIDENEIPHEVRLELDEHAWFDRNSGGHTHRVGLKRPNPWGLYDMIGNVWEWCADVWHGDYMNAPHDGRPWMVGAERQPRRCLRGGAWDMNAFRCRSSYRSFDHSDLATSRFGLRVAMDSVAS